MGLNLRAGTAFWTFILLASVLATAATPGAASSPDERALGVLPSYLILLTDQQGHAASLAVREAVEPALNDLADRRTALVSSPEDIGHPEVVDLNRQIDAIVGEMRVAIASDAYRRHEATRSAVESIVAELGGTVHYRSPVLNLLAARLPEGAVEFLRTHPLVASVEPDAVRDLQLDVSVPSTGATSFWTGGFTGGVYELVDPDTGVDRTHPALVGKISDEAVFHAAAQGQGNYNDDPTTPDDLHGHGTHIAGIMGSQDATYRGLAYGLFGVINAKWGYLTTGGGGQGIESDSMRAMDWAILTAGGDVLSLSFGGGSNDNGNSGWGRYMDMLVDDLGIPVSVAAGNSGPGGGTLGQPATSFNIVTTGAMYDGGTAARGDDTIAGFSSRGPTGDGRIKPDIMAPGSSIVATAHDWEGGNSDWVSMSGTSMAAPHVGAGLILYMHATGGPAFPARSKAVFLNTATDLGAAGPDANYGWGYMDLSLAWARRNNVVQGAADEGIPQFFRLAGAANDRATMVWQKHVVYNGVSYPGTWNALNNLELWLYDELLNARLDTSVSPRDNVEQVQFPSAAPGVVKVTVNGALGSLVSVEPFALAGVSLPVAVNGPALAPAVVAPPNVNQGDTFLVTANVANPGGLRVFGTTVRLNIPPGLALVSGANPATLGTIVEGTFRSASWTLSAGPAGTYGLTADASGNAYDETYAGTSPPVSVLVADTQPPAIASPSAVPSPQNPGGIVNVSAGVTDNVGLAGVWVEVWDPADVSLGNVSMPYDPITGRRYFARTYATLGDYRFTITAEDTSGLLATVSGVFRIEDMIAPTLSGLAATPNPQEIYFSVNVTATATDNVGVTGAYLEVQDPLGGSTNVSMDRTGSTLSFDRVYGVLGTYDYRISVHDAAMNWASVADAFLIWDTTAPVADAGPDQGVEFGSSVMFDGSASTDNVGIVSYRWDFTDGGPVTLTGATVAYTFLNLGTFPVTLTVRDASGNAATDTLTVSVVERTPPEIRDVRADPPLQDVGLTVSVSADVWDRFGVGGVFLQVVDTAGTVVNVTMSLVGGRYERALPYATKGVHVFEIRAVDIHDNWNSSSGAFVIADLTPPSVSMSAGPDPQDIFATVDVTAAVADNDVLADVWVEVRDPTGRVVAVVPMTFAGGLWRASFDPAVLGPHRAIVWAADVSGNLGSASATIRSVDRTPPTLLVDAPQTVEVFAIIPITATVADDLETYVATLEVLGPSGESLGNRTLVEASPITASWRFATLGAHEWVAWAADPSGNAVVLEGSIVVRDSQPPLADAGPDRDVAQGTWVPLDGSRSTDNYGIASYTWTFTASGGNQVLRRDRTTFQFRQVETVEVTLAVMDLSGNVGTDTATIRVVAADRDGDGVADDTETSVLKTDPTRPDTDGDGLPDGADPNPTAAELDIVRWFVSWWGILVLLVILLALLAAGARRKKDPARPSPPAAPPTTQAFQPPSTLVDMGLPPPPDDEGEMPPPPSD